MTLNDIRKLVPVAVHCPTLEDVDKLLTLFPADKTYKSSWNENKKNTCYRINTYGGISVSATDLTIVGYSNIKFYQNEGYTIIEASDLELEPESKTDNSELELTPEETIKLFHEMCSAHVCSDCPMNLEVSDYIECESLCIKHPDITLNILKNYKKEKETKTISITIDVTQYHPTEATINELKKAIETSLKADGYDCTVS